MFLDKVHFQDEDGVLSFSELGVVMKSLGQRPSGETIQIQIQNTKYNLVELDRRLGRGKRG